VSFLTLDSQSGLLRTCLLGDSGFLVIRGRKIHYRSKEQQHFFNAPFQLGFNNGVPLTDLPDHSITKDFTLLNNDIVIAATDGLFDNLGDDEILKIYISFLDNNFFFLNDELIVTKLHEIALALLKAARQVGENPSALSPFARAALQLGYFYIGGYFILTLEKARRHYSYGLAGPKNRRAVPRLIKRPSMQHCASSFYA